MMSALVSLVPRSATPAGRRSEIARILHESSLNAVFQPIIDLRSGELYGYEGLIRGPEGSALHSPVRLFQEAREQGLGLETERLALQVILAAFSRLELPGKIFINMSPECFQAQSGSLGENLSFLNRLALRPDRVVLELTENQATVDFTAMREAMDRCRRSGLRIAMDDLGAGHSTLRLWSELRPDFVKLDMHFIQGLHLDPIKRQFVHSMQLIAEKAGTALIAEGIETEAELLLLQDLGIPSGQGYHIARPVALPRRKVRRELTERLRTHSDRAGQGLPRQNLATAAKLLKAVPAVAPDTQANDVYEIFVADPALPAVAVVKDGSPVGTISRFKMTDRFSRMYQRELFGRKPCTHFMDPDPLVVDKDMGIQELSSMIANADAQHLSNGFAITDQGRYVGMGTGQDLVREFTSMQLSAARYANPLTQLPGNVPINEEISRLAASGRDFVVCHCDIDNFKPFNDMYGYRRGDDVIVQLGKVLAENCVSGMDFLGHVGGDDFIVLFRSADWEERCRRMLARFADLMPDFYTEQDRERGGFAGADRGGAKIFYPLATLSIGAVPVKGGKQCSDYAVSGAAAEAKRMAKTLPGNSLFIERRAVF